MIYIRNISNRIIHLADAMLLPDDKVEDKDPRTGKPYSENPVIGMFIEKGMMELVDVRPLEKQIADKKEIKVEFEEVPEEAAPEEKTEKKEDGEKEAVSEETAEKKNNLGKRKKEERSLMNPK